MQYGTVSVVSSSVLHHWVWEFQIGLQDAAFLPSKASFCSIFQTDCSRGEGHWTVRSLKTVVGASNGVLFVKFFHSNEEIFVM